MNALSARNYSIDTLKLICCFLVVFIHCDYPYKQYVIPITDVAVPLFFSISGYFTYGTKNKWGGRMLRILRILGWSIALYLLKTELYQWFAYHHLYCPSLRDGVNFFLFNDVSVSIHLWYLSAYLYVLGFAYLIDKFDLWEYAFYAVIPLLLIGSYIRYYISDICPEQIQYFRNAYFTGLPYFLIGATIKAKDSFFRRICVLKPFTLVLMLLLFVARYFIGTVGIVNLVIREMDLMLLTLCVLVFTTSIVQEKDNIISRLGRSYSLYVYVLHILLMSICQRAIMYCPETIRNWYMFINPICVFLLSLATTYLLKQFKILK